VLEKEASSQTLGKAMVVLVLVADERPGQEIGEYSCNQEHSSSRLITFRICSRPNLHNVLASSTTLSVVAKEGYLPLAARPEAQTTAFVLTLELLSSSGTCELLHRTMLECLVLPRLFIGSAD